MRGQERRQGGDGNDRGRGGGWGGREDRWAARHSTWTTPFRLRDSLSIRMVPVDGRGRLADLLAPQAARDLAHSPPPSFTGGSWRARESSVDSRRFSPGDFQLNVAAWLQSVGSLDRWVRGTVGWRDDGMAGCWGGYSPERCHLAESRVSSPPFRVPGISIDGTPPRRP